MAWGAGYAGIWATKWLIQTLFSTGNGFASAIGAAESYTIIPFLPEGVSHKYFLTTCAFLGIAFVATILIYVLKKRRSRLDVLLLCVALIPFVWSVLLLGHNVIHIFFTYRNLAATAFCCWLILFPIKQHENSHSDPLLQ